MLYMISELDVFQEPGNRSSKKVVMRQRRDGSCEISGNETHQIVLFALEDIPRSIVVRNLNSPTYTYYDLHSTGSSNPEDWTYFNNRGGHLYIFGQKHVYK